MTNLTELVKEYKKTKNNLIIDKIYAELKSTIQQKAGYIYFTKYYPLNLYHNCKFCRNCDKLNNVPKSEHIIICKDCDICKCIKGFFNLRKNNLCEYEDVENDIWLEIMRTIENFDITKDFNTYLFSCLWEFVPSFITKNFVKSLSNKSLTKIDEEGNETEMEIPDEQDKKTEPKISIEEIFEICKDNFEKKILTLILQGKTINRTVIAKELNVSPQYISLILKDLRKRLKKFLSKI
jgi:RNA polymerase sigma factor (sigma-70 family)